VRSRVCTRYGDRWRGLEGRASYIYTRAFVSVTMGSKRAVPMLDTVQPRARLTTVALHGG
jgi:hypothetical protein